MPQLITHNIFAKDVFAKLPNEIKDTFKSENAIYEMFSQSFDNYYYYVNLNIKKAKKIRYVGKKGHKTNVNKYFSTIIDNIQDMNIKKDEQALAYLYGSINHYVLDSICHPFIFYKTGVYNKKDKTTYKYIGLHGDMESNIDAFFYINKFNRLYTKANVTKEFLPKVKFNNNLTKLYNKTISSVYKEENMAKYYLKSYHQARILYKTFINDRYGFKKILYKIHDKLNIFRTNNYQYYSTYIKAPNIDYLNLSHKKWFFPSDKTISSKESFIDLYQKAVDKAVQLIIIAHNGLFNDRNIEQFKNSIGNLSYVRGLDCDKSKYMKTFEF